MFTFKRIALIAACIIVLIVTVTCKKKSSLPVPGPNQVFMENMAYTPTTITTTHGSTITWTNQDNMQHTVTSDNSLFDSGLLDPGKSFSFTFATAGTYTYHCNVHSTMHGTVTVQ